MNIADLLRGQHQPPSDADLEIAAAKVLIGNQQQLREMCGDKAADALIALATQTLTAPTTKAQT